MPQGMTKQMAIQKRALMARRGASLLT